MIKDIKAFFLEYPKELEIVMEKALLSLDRSGACHFMGEKGCKLPRHQRPYRCTWYFCDLLLVQIEICPPRHYRSFIKDVKNLARTRGDMLSVFYEIWTFKNRAFV